MSRLDDKVVVITGGGGVLGSFFAKELASNGAKVAVLDLRLEAAEEVVSEIVKMGNKAIAVACNVLDKESVINAEKQIFDTYGACDILINGAGGNHPKGTTDKEYMEPEDLIGDNDVMSFFNLDDKGIEFVFNLNFMGTLIPSQVFGKRMAMKKDGVILNISSMCAFSPLTKIPAYSGAKAAVSNFTRWLSVHMSKMGIRVNAIAPGFFVTNQNKKLLLNEDGSYTDRSKKILSQTPMDRFGEPEELLGTLLWLVDNKTSGFVNGIIVPVDGGFSAYSGV
ncbi:MAG: SDR family oxidoreductase [Vallitalea sp.]|nr:SDR family oxidoreductase [Vallitalea sp.]